MEQWVNSLIFFCWAGLVGIVKKGISPSTIGLSIQFQTFHLSGRDQNVAVVVMVETNFSVKL